METLEEKRRLEHPRVGMIGAGRWGKNIIRTLSELGYDLSIAYGGSAETAAFLKVQYPNDLLTPDYREMLKDPTILSVFIATPIPTHASIARDALLAGKHVFVEKPLSVSLDEVSELYVLAAERNLTLATGYIYSYDPGFVSLIQACASAETLHASSHWEKHGSFDSPLSTNLLSHEIACATELLGQGSLRVKTHTENMFEGTYESARGSMDIYINRESEEKVKKLSVIARGSEYILENHRLIKKNPDGSEETLYSSPTDELLSIELRTFLELTREGSATNEKRRHIDCSIAAVLETLPPISSR